MFDLFKVILQVKHTQKQLQKLLLKKYSLQITIKLRSPLLTCCSYKVPITLK